MLSVTVCNLFAKYMGRNGNAVSCMAVFGVESRRRIAGSVESVFFMNFANFQS